MVDIFWVIVGTGSYILGGGRWWWVVLGLFCLLVSGGGRCKVYFG